MNFLFVKKTLKQQKGEISILVDSTQKGYITLYLQIVTSGTYCNTETKDRRYHLHKVYRHSFDMVMYNTNNEVVAHKE